MRIVVDALVFLAIAAAIIFYFLTMPSRIDPARLADIDKGDAVRGERMFFAGGCTSCHAAAGSKGDDRLKLVGGQALVTPFGTFHAPNISTSARYGIGRWSGIDFANAMLRGVSPEGSHYYPAFPYTSYTRMRMEDIADLWAFMQTLPAVETPSEPHDLPIVFRFRRGLGLWKRLFLSDQPVIEFVGATDKILSGRYLVEGPGHCGECHTPRDAIGGPETRRWLAGGPAPEGKGSIPNITPSPDGIGGWTEGDIAYVLETGFTPEFDSLSGSMVDVQRNMARLPAADREAIAAYLKAIPARGKDG